MNRYGKAEENRSGRDERQRSIGLKTEQGYPSLERETIGRHDPWPYTFRACVSEG